MREKTGYIPQDVEKKWYKIWEEKGYFTPLPDKLKKPFCIVIPPPNVTGSLHMGHALNNTIQDIIIRWKRMCGYSTLWLPGIDHAGIPTQMLVERELAKEGKSRFSLGREKFEEAVWAWKEKYGNIIIEQLKKLGCSCDWTRTRFTMDEEYSNAVLTAFERLYEKGYIYRGKRIINWCCKCKTAVSDIEVVHKETDGFLYYIKYPLADHTDKYLTVATTRPETMLGDTAVAVNPEDERYKDIVGKYVILPIMERKIPVIADEYVDISFGTGVLKITPAHDPYDFEIGQRHDLPQIVVIGTNGKMTDAAGKYKGEDRFDARKKIVEELRQLNLLDKIENYTYSIGHHDRCDTVIEPLLSLQWFVKMKELAKPSIEVVKEGKIKFIPERFKDIYLQWMENIKDWCISRQIWWGHRLPVWYCKKCQELAEDKGVVVSRTKPAKCPDCEDVNLVQDEDVLDTWFSSALWPYATLGWPSQTDDLKYFYPTSVLSTARDIIYLWVARMIMTGIEFTGNIPFSNVFIHPTVLNFEGKRMSKSLGTGIDPLLLLEKYGACATRLGLILQASKTQDMKFHEATVITGRNFCNKIYNAGRFVKMNLQDNLGYIEKIETDKLSLSEKWILSRLTSVATEVNDNFEKYDFSDAAKCLYNFTWNEFCDWYIEIAKHNLKKESEKENTQKVLLYTFSNILKLLHPFVPFVTSEIWNMLFPTEECIMIQKWYMPDEKLRNLEAESKMERCFEIIRAIRNLKQGKGIITEKNVDVFVKIPDNIKIDDIKDYIINLSRIQDVKIVQEIKQSVVSKTSENIEISLSVL